MNYQLLVLWALTAYVSCDTKEDAIKVERLGDGIKLICSDGIFKDGSKELNLPYDDKSSGEYICNEISKIYVKFRTCDNCVELDTPSIVGMAFGNLVASVVIGVAVYLIASQSQSRQPPPTKKRSDRQNLIPNQPGTSSDHYQPLRHKQPKDEYDVVRK
ncbi:T-cell surface glycoprotein CD3 gamma chain-like [Nematolebias whitei]|uniref:T-cell surface glycoprotein CD3 gamma chain-like n=1 Tax=Nematolebias whitei TaxID=451745 RepID=UPI001896B1E7|nr:T-cell surface glycoprotein CD3 gamma chain-like [Nematolebias whitei]